MCLGNLQSLGIRVGEGPCYSNIGILGSDHWLQPQNTEVQRGEQNFSCIFLHGCKPIYCAEVVSGDIKGQQHSTFHSSSFMPSLKSRFNLDIQIYGDNEKVTVFA